MLAHSAPSGSSTARLRKPKAGARLRSVPYSVLLALLMLLGLAACPGHHHFPRLTLLMPNSGPIGTVVTITGINFGTTQGTSRVTFNGTAATPTNWSATSIVAPAPTGAITGNVVVTIEGRASNGLLFTVTGATPPPTITMLNPISGPLRTPVTITGTNFGSTQAQGNSTVTFDGTLATPTSWSPTSIMTTVPTGATTGNVVVTVGGQASNGVMFTVTTPPPAPAITNLNPNSGAVGASIMINGMNFGANQAQGNSTVTFNGTATTPTGWSATSIMAPVPAGATSGNVVVTVGGQASNGVMFTVTTPPPTITNLNPSSGLVGASIMINGMTFGTARGNSTVTFDGIATTPTSWSATTIMAPVPAGATTGNVVVTVGGQASNAVLFTVTTPPPAPVITNLTPNSGLVGASIMINGMNFGATQGNSTVTFNGTGTTPSSWSATSIMAPVPTGATSGNVVVAVGGQASNGVNFTVGAANLPGDSVTWHYDNSRSGLNPNETILTTANVKSTSFGKVGEFTVDGQIDGQILYLGQVVIPGVGTKNVVYAATENDTVYALDADSIAGTSATVLWKTSVLLPGETAATGLPCGNIIPSGITAAPVLDRSRNAIYVVAESENAAHTFFHRIHALDLTTGKELFGGPTTISPTFLNQSGTVTFDPAPTHDRAALLEVGNTIYTAWSGLYGDCGTYYGWLVGYSADTLAQTTVVNLTPNVKGGGMWMGGGGPAADSSGSIYTITGNGFGTTGPIAPDYPNSFVRLSSTAGLTVADFFAPDNTIMEDAGDVDLGSAAPLLLPDLKDNLGTTHHLAVAAGKDGFMYVLNRDNLGQYSSMNNNIPQFFRISNDENFSTPIYFNNTVYVCPSITSVLSAYPIANAKLATMPSSQSTNAFGRCVPTVSANGNSDGIVWALYTGSPPSVLCAYDATNLATELYDSNQAAAGRDHFAAGAGSFITPMVSNGKVFFGTRTTIVVFGLLAP
jgi:IPT/TIG domain-containing protein